MSHQTLYDVIYKEMYLPEDNYNTLFYYVLDKLKLRWSDFCNVHNNDVIILKSTGTELIALPTELAKIFINKNIEWAKREVYRDIDKHFWPSD